MDRVELRLALLRIAHHPAQSDKLSLEIALRWEEAFADLMSDSAGAERAAPPKPKRAAPS